MPLTVGVKLISHKRLSSLILYRIILECAHFLIIFSSTAQFEISPQFADFSVRDVLVYTELAS